MKYNLDEIKDHKEKTGAIWPSDAEKLLEMVEELLEENVYLSAKADALDFMLEKETNEEIILSGSKVCPHGHEWDLCPDCNH